MAKNIEIEKMSFAKDMPLPSYSSDNCSGLDLYAANKKNLILKSGKTVIVSSGIKIALKKILRVKSDLDLDLQKNLVLLYLIRQEQLMKIIEGKLK